METRTLKAQGGNHYLQNHELQEVFDWKEVEKDFSWYETGKLNMAYEAIDRHALSHNKNKIALHFSDGVRNEAYSFYDMMRLSNKAANVLRQKTSLTKGDRFFIFMPRTPELYYTLIGALKLGLIVGPLFEAFMEGAVFDRLQNSEAKAIITTPALLQRIPLDRLPKLEKVLVVGKNIEENEKIIDFQQAMKDASVQFDIEWVDREDGMILHYTSGSTGTPKGVLHVHNAMLQQYQTARWVLDLQEDDIYWCTADPGWVTGTSYGIFGPWLNGITNVVIGGRFSPDTWYGAIEKYGVTVWYSAPTAFRMLMGAGDFYVEKHDLSTLRHVLSVGEPLNPEVIRWGVETLGHYN